MIAVDMQSERVKTSIGGIKRARCFAVIGKVSRNGDNGLCLWHSGCNNYHGSAHVSAMPDKMLTGGR